MSDKDWAEEALSNLFALNSQNKPVTAELIKNFRANGFAANDRLTTEQVMRFIYLLLENPIRYPYSDKEKQLDSDLYNLLREIRHVVIKLNYYINIDDEVSKGWLSETDAIVFRHSILSVMDKLWPPVFGTVSIEDLDWIFWGRIIQSYNVKLVEHLVQIIKSRLPSLSSGEDWERLYQADPDGFKYLELMNPTLKKNKIYWDYYVSQQLENTGKDISRLPEDWTSELVEPPIPIPDNLKR